MQRISGIVLSFFGGLSFLAGLLLLLYGISEESNLLNAVVIYYASGLVLSGAVLLGFSRIISLLEGIEQNTRKAPLPSNQMADVPSPAPGDQSAGVALSRGSYRGMGYTLHNDGSAVGRIGEKLFTWRSVTDLHAWRDANPI